ncbi:hypothetical protein Tco_1005875 [Tanacetum coccineum]|uniref:Uncharacterized protein n=1 Tax=Tanacetum coccineum TaxID=301880 RepID=A0ABQ5FGE0_9ASTR
MSMRVVYSLRSLVALRRRNSKEHLTVMDTIEVTMETKNFPSISDPSGHLPCVGGLDEHVMIDELSTEAQNLNLSCNQGAISSGGFVSVNKSSGAGPSVFASATPGIAHDADATGPPQWLERRYESLVAAYQGLQTRILELYNEKDKFHHQCNELSGMVLACDGDIKLFKEIIKRLTKERDELKKQGFELDKEVIRVHMGGR